MVITKTPLRISFLGGGTDYPVWYNQNGGEVISTTINKYCYIQLRPLPELFEHKHRIIYSKIDSEKFKEDDNKILNEYLKHLKLMFNDFDYSSLITFKVIKSKSAAPVPLINTFDSLPEQKTKIKNLFITGMEYFYPEDRGFGNSVKLGIDISDEI